jgi:hypothetical protein
LVYLAPIFFEGLRETKDPTMFLAENGLVDIIHSLSDKIVPVIPKLIVPI